MPTTTPQPKRTTRANSQADLTLDAIQAIIETAKLETMSAFRNEIALLKDELKVHIATLTARVDKIERDHAKLMEDFETHTASGSDIRRSEEMCQAITTEVEQRLYRRNNIIIRGVLEPMSGSVDERKETDKNVSSKIFEVLGLTNAEIESVKRLGKARTDNKRPLCVRLQNIENRNYILKNAKKLNQDSNFSSCYINPDLTMIERQLDFNLRKERKRLREGGRDVIIYKGKIMDRPKPQGFQQ